MKASRCNPILGTGLLILVWFLQNIPIAAAGPVDYWPTNGWRHSTPEAQGMRSKPLADMLAQIQQQIIHIDNITVVRNGYIVLDAYFHPFKKAEKHIIHSNTKSVMSALIGIALERGEIKSPKDQVLGFFPGKTIANNDARKRAMTLENLLTMTSGFACKDSYRHSWVGLRQMRRSPDWAQYVLNLPMAHEPGRYFEYCNGVSHLLSAILQKQTKLRAESYAQKHLFGPLGIKDVYWETTAAGSTVGYGQMWLQPYAMAKIGLLYLSDGKWAGRQVVPKDWVKTSTRRHNRHRIP